jgi:hypothetical protein
VASADPVNRHVHGVLRVDVHRDRRARLHPRHVHLRNDLVEDGAVGRGAVVALNPTLDPQHR